MYYTWIMYINGLKQIKPKVLVFILFHIKKIQNRTMKCDKSKILVEESINPCKQKSILFSLLFFVSIANIPTKSKRLLCCINTRVFSGWLNIFIIFFLFKQQLFFSFWTIIINLFLSASARVFEEKVKILFKIKVFYKLIIFF